MILGLQPDSHLLPQYVWSAFQRRSTDISHFLEVKTPQQIKKLYDHISYAYFKFLDEKFDWSYSLDEAPPVPPVSRAAAAAVGDTTFLFGGRYKSSTGELLDNITALVAISRINFEVFHLLVKIPAGAGREGIATATDGSRFVYLAGGRTRSDCDSATPFAWRFDVRTFEILRLPDLPEARCGGSMALLDGRLHFLGGSTRPGELQKDSGAHFTLEVEPESPAAGIGMNWERRVALPYGLVQHLAVVLEDETDTPSLYVMGGARANTPLGSAGAIDCDRGDNILRSRTILKLSRFGTRWLRSAELPLQMSHFQSSTRLVNYGGGILIFGGIMTAKTPDSKDFRSMGVRNVVLFDARRNVTSLVGQLPNLVAGKVSEGCGREGLVTLTNMPHSEHKIWVLGGETCGAIDATLGESQGLIRRFESQAVSVSSILIN
jgi:hypothetical protein